jgi:predicted sugar kinase
MQIEIGAPACLPLGLVKLEDGTLARLGVTLRHPAINLAARAGDALDVTGARADHVAASARRYLRHQALPEQAEIEIELAIPSQMGLGSDALMALSGAQAAAWVHGQAFEDVPAVAAAAGVGPEHALEVQAYAQGGVLLVAAPRAEGGAPAVLRRQTLSHSDAAAWAFVLYLPRVPAGAALPSEAERLTGLLRAASGLSRETGRLVDTALWPALAADDLEGFGRAWQDLQQHNAVALEAAGAALPLSDDERAILDIYAANGAAAWGRSPTGLALFALVRGASASVALRKQVVARVGIHGGTAMAAVVDNDGARHALQAKPPTYTGASPLVAKQ